MTEAARKSDGYRYIEDMDRIVRSAIARGEIDMVDLSQTLMGSQGDLYVDVVHYTPTANEHLAERILNDLGIEATR